MGNFPDLDVYRLRSYLPYMGSKEAQLQMIPCDICGKLVDPSFMLVGQVVVRHHVDDEWHEKAYCSEDHFKQSRAGHLLP